MKNSYIAMKEGLEKIREKYDLNLSNSDQVEFAPLSNSIRKMEEFQKSILRGIEGNTNIRPHHLTGKEKSENIVAGLHQENKSLKDEVNFSYTVLTCIESSKTDALVTTVTDPIWGFRRRKHNSWFL
jgi:hypothetical protein